MQQEIKKYDIKSLSEFEKTEMEAPYVVIGEPCEELLTLEKAGFCVIAELAFLKGLSEEETAEALCRVEAVTQYKNVCIDASGLPQEYLKRVWCNHIGIPVEIAETERLIIRESIEEDGEAFRELYTDKDCAEFLEKLPVEMDSALSYQKYIRDYRAGQYAFYEYGMWSVIEKESGRFIGRAGVEQFTAALGESRVLSLGYAILPGFRGRGYAVESCQAILQYCKACDYAEEICVRIDPANAASLKVYERLCKTKPLLLPLMLL